MISCMPICLLVVYNLYPFCSRVHAFGCHAPLQTPGLHRSQGLGFAQAPIHRRVRQPGKGTAFLHRRFPSLRTNENGEDARVGLPADGDVGNPHGWLRMSEVRPMNTSSSPPRVPSLKGRLTTKSQAFGEEMGAVKKTSRWQHMASDSCLAVCRRGWNLTSIRHR